MNDKQDSGSGTAIVAIALTLLFEPGTVGITRAESAREIAQSCFPSVVMLLMEDAHKQPLCQGSGFAVEDGIVASNCHVVAGASGGYAKLVNRKTKLEIDGLAGIDLEWDLVLLKVNGLTAPPLALADGEPVVGDEIYAVGNPRGLEGTFSSGIVSGVREIGGGKLLQITAPISPGSSGGPVLDKQGKVVGVAVASFKGGQNLNFAIPSGFLKKLLVAKKPAEPLAAKSTRAAGRMLEQIGGKSTDGIVPSQLAFKKTSFGSEVLGLDYSFSLKNNLRTPVKSVHCLVIYYDRSREPLDVQERYLTETIPANLAKRVDKYFVPDTVLAFLDADNPTKQMEIRVLDFEIIGE